MEDKPIPLTLNLTNDFEGILFCLCISKVRDPPLSLAVLGSYFATLSSNTGAGKSGILCTRLARVLTLIERPLFTWVTRSVTNTTDSDRKGILFYPHRNKAIGISHHESTKFWDYILSLAKIFGQTVLVLMRWNDTVCFMLRVY